MRPYENKKVTFESRKFVKSFLSVDQNAAVSVREMPPDSSEVQFVVRVQVYTFIHNYVCIYNILCHTITYALGACACNNVVLPLLVLYSTEQALHCALCTLKTTEEQYLLLFFSMYTEVHWTIYNSNSMPLWKTFSCCEFVMYMYLLIDV